MTAALHDFALTVDCPRKPRGCSAPAGQRCVNWAVSRGPDQHPPATRVPHTARLRTAQATIPQRRQLETASSGTFDDGTPLPEEPDWNWT